MSLSQPLLTHGQNDRRRNKYTCCAWAGGTFFQLCCCVSFLVSGRKYVLVLLTYISRVQYSCGIKLVFWFWWEIVFGVTYILSVQYSCAVVSVFGCGGKQCCGGKQFSKREHLLISYEQFLQKNLIGLLYYDPLANVCIL